MKSVARASFLCALPILLAAAPSPDGQPSGSASAVATAPTPNTAAHASAAVFPDALSSKYAKEAPGKRRMHTCLDQYHANKSTGANGGMKWIQKGGGYYSACLKHLKPA